MKILQHFLFIMDMVVCLKRVEINQIRIGKLHIGDDEIDMIELVSNNKGGT